MSAVSLPRLAKCLLALALLPLTALAAPAPLTLHAAPTGPHDLAVSGPFAGLAEGEKKWIKWSDLRALPTEERTLEGEFLPGPQKVTVVLLSSLLDRLPLGDVHPTVFATCSDGYMSVFDPAFVSRWRPVLVLEINGQGPEKWPPPGLTYNPGPFVITVDEGATPGVKSVLDIDHKKPWGVTALHIVESTQAFHPFSVGAWEKLSTRALQGRELWVNSCLSCHVGPGEKLGGTKAARPFAVLAAYANYNPEHLRRYVRDPQSIMPGAKMTPHPHYTDAELEALLAFLRAEAP